MFWSSLPELFLEKMVWKYAANLKENTHAKHTSAGAFSCKFAAYFQNNFS